MLASAARPGRVVRVLAGAARPSVRLPRALLPTRGLPSHRSGPPWQRSGVVLAGTRAARTFAVMSSVGLVVWSVSWTGAIEASREIEGAQCTGKKPNWWASRSHGGITVASMVPTGSNVRGPTKDLRNRSSEHLISHLRVFEQIVGPSVSVFKRIPAIAQHCYRYGASPPAGMPPKRAAPSPAKKKEAAAAPDAEPEPPGPSTPTPQPKA